MKQWYVVQTRVMAETRAEYHLRNQGFEIFLPKFYRQRKHARRVEQVLRPLFPGYLFVHLDPEFQQWRSINGTVGVLRLLTAGIEPIPVPRRIIQQILENRDKTGAVVMRRQEFRPGEPLVIVTGAFAECEGLFEEMADDQRVVMLLDLMGRKVRARVPVSALAIAV